jgi:hypothetical protein
VTESEGKRKPGWLWLWVVIFVVALLALLLWAWPARQPPDSGHELRSDARVAMPALAPPAAVPLTG